MKNRGGFTLQNFSRKISMKFRRIKKNLGGFTLLELLIVIGIVTVLTTMIILVLNPSEFKREARDVVRSIELRTLSGAAGLAAADNPNLFFGTPGKVYISLPDTNLNCSSYILPVLPSGWTYGCVIQDNLQKVDGTGWVPIAFDSLSFRPFSKLPIDPINKVEGGLYYSYTVGSWEFNGLFESDKYVAMAESDGGDAPLLYEFGSDLVGIPPQINNRVISGVGN